MIIITGSIAYDYIMGFPGKFGDHILPEQTHNINLSFIVNKFEKHRGGTGGNVSYTLGLLTTPHILFSYAGKDFDEYKKDFEKIGIDTTHIVIDAKNYTATGFAMTDTANNQIWGYFYGAATNNDRLQLSLVAKNGDLVYIGPQGAKASMSFVTQCITQKISYMFDPGFILTEISDVDLTTALQHAAYITFNEYEEELVKKRLPSWRKILEDKVVITTLGERGARIYTTKQMYIISPVVAKKVNSTTGAGDAWRGGFLAGLAKGYDLQTCGNMGAVAAVFAIGHYGTQEHTYSLKAFVACYKKTYHTPLAL